jgi:PBP1b-binding outer membrane lipoprotein LpoB
MMKITTAIIALGFFLTGCDTERRPSYDELKSQNEELESQLAGTHEKIQQAKLDLDALRQEINNLEGDSCHEDSASDLDSNADNVESTLDEAEEESN